MGRNCHTRRWAEELEQGRAAVLDELAAPAPAPAVELGPGRQAWPWPFCALPSSVPVPG